ncbi:hypothetical protein BC834DRAFT_855636 [Gloeopeniophorella convolvens]|nr:hypothetical protein BC834DRAFT_855636 [Gloeopeniophorella convolvens]
MRLPSPFPFPFLPKPAVLHSRFVASTAATAATSPPPLPYFVPRNSRGSLPVYTDVRNGGSQYLISVRNVQGNAKALADDLLHDLSSPASPALKARITRSNHLVLSGIRRGRPVLDWLARRGF